MSPSEKFKRSTLLSESQYHEAVGIAKRYEWSLAKTLGKLVGIGLKDERENSTLGKEKNSATE
jgi:hypothetical protein